MTTPERERYFQVLPDKAGPFGACYGKSDWAPLGFYQGKAHETYDFAAANLQCKYGAAWKQRAAELAHARLRSWGLNTIGNWSAAETYLLHKIPYTVPIKFSASHIAGSAGHWQKFPDPFDPAFRAALRERMEDERGKSAGDKWCLGYFSWFLIPNS